jgi:hypothetical protein
MVVIVYPISLEAVADLTAEAHGKVMLIITTLILKQAAVAHPVGKAAGQSHQLLS